MKLLIDENLSPLLADAISDLFPQSVHVRNIGLREATDSEIWKYAEKNNFIIISKDSDFHQLSFLYGFPPKFIWIRKGNCSTRIIETLLRINYKPIEIFFSSESSSMMIIE